MLFLFSFGFLFETEGSDLSRKVWEAVPVHLVLVRCKSEGRRPSYGKTVVLQNANLIII